MVKGIKITFVGKDIERIEEIPPFRSKNLVIFSNGGKLLLWEPIDIKPTKTEMKKYVGEIADKLSSKLGNTSVLAHGVLKYDWVSGNDFDVTLGGTTIAKVTYTDNTYDIISNIQYLSRFANLATVKEFI